MFYMILYKAAWALVACLKVLITIAYSISYLLSELSIIILFIYLQRWLALTICLIPHFFVNKLLLRTLVDVFVVIG